MSRLRPPRTHLRTGTGRVALGAALLLDMGPLILDAPVVPPPRRARAAVSPVDLGSPASSFCILVTPANTEVRGDARAATSD